MRWVRSCRPARPLLHDGLGGMGYLSNASHGREDQNGKTMLANARRSTRDDNGGVSRRSQCDERRLRFRKLRQFAAFQRVLSACL